MKEIKDIIRAYDKAVKQGKQTALATVVHVEGSSYRRPGARMLITTDGQLTGAISGGCLEGDALRKASLVMIEKRTMLVTYDTNDEEMVEVSEELAIDCVWVKLTGYYAIWDSNSINPYKVDIAQFKDSVSCLCYFDCLQCCICSSKLSG